MHRLQFRYTYEYVDSASRCLYKGEINRSLAAPFFRLTSLAGFKTFAADDIGVGGKIISSRGDYFFSLPTTHKEIERKKTDRSRPIFLHLFCRTNHSTRSTSDCNYDRKFLQLFDSYFLCGFHFLIQFLPGI